MNLNRKILAEFHDWKERKGHKPLLLYGARQVGKTYAVKQFGETRYQDTAYFNIEDDDRIATVFEHDFDISRLIGELSLLHGRPIKAGETLIIFDEVQSSNRILSSLKYFNENAPQYDIIATGSLLGLSVGTGKYSFPVGKVDNVRMYPLDFEEFLSALGHDQYAAHIRACFANNEKSFLHEELLRLYRLYLVIGGLPKVVTRYLAEEDLFAAREEQTALDANYVSDMAWYIDALEAGRTLEAWRSLPHQLAKENRKFQYRVVKSGGRAYQYESAIFWLKAAGLVYTCCRTSDGTPPYMADNMGTFFKAYSFDTGMLCAKMVRDPSVIVLESPAENPSLSDTFRGALAENYVMQAMSANGIEPFYWASSGIAELDFLFQDSKGNAVPLEVKSGERVRSKSLSEFMKRYKPPCGIRISTRNFGMENDIKSIPLYAVFCLTS
ncbi:ATPase [Spirochaetia bacterium]|nr:ATPase [Spirochaetia bacterium]